MKSSSIMHHATTSRKSSWNCRTFLDYSGFHPATHGNLRLIHLNTSRTHITRLVCRVHNSVKMSSCFQRTTYPAAVASGRRGPTFGEVGEWFKGWAFVVFWGDSVSHSVSVWWTRAFMNSSYHDGFTALGWKNPGWCSMFLRRVWCELNKIFEMMNFPFFHMYKWW